MEKFRIYQRVKVTGLQDNVRFNGQLGTVRCLKHARTAAKQYGISFDQPFYQGTVQMGHELEGALTDRSGWYVGEGYISLAEVDEVEITLAKYESQ
jgi:hypothetical protein